MDCHTGASDLASAGADQTLQHTATHCNTLQHTATHSNKLQHTETHRQTLQHTVITHSRTQEMLQDGKNA